LRNAFSIRRIILPALLALTAIGALLVVFADSLFPVAAEEPVTLLNREELRGLSDRADSRRIYRIDVPEGATDLVFSVFAKDRRHAIDLYLKRGAAPTPTSFDSKATGPGVDKMIALRTPQAGKYFLLLHGAHGAYEDIGLIASFAPKGAIFKTGMHAHRLYNGGDWNGPASPVPDFRYSLIRDWDISHLHDAVIWKRDGSIDLERVDRVYSGHARYGAKVIKTFGTVPTWASRRPTEPNKQYPNWPGAKSGPRDLDEYEEYVYRFVSHTKDRLRAVEGWNEPYACNAARPEFTTMTPTELADVQKRVYLATKRVSKDILVFSPAQAYVCGIPTILEARTSDGEPMSKYFDALAWHAYNRSAHANAGPSYAAEISAVRRHLAQAGLSHMPIIDTEHGWLRPPKEGGKEFHAMSDAEKGQVLYDTAQLAKSLGLLGIVWYGYDNSMIGRPMDNSRISAYLQRIHDDFDTP
jgi:hypothetical protein